MRKNKQRWYIQLGDDQWGRFTYARPEGGPLRLLGSVARGAQLGALAQTAEGRYVQVNGDHVTPLSDSQLRRAVGAAQVAQAHRPVRRGGAKQPVVVTLKRRRTVSRP